jgi:peptidoglycan-associated lipoprotein
MARWVTLAAAVLALALAGCQSTPEETGGAGTSGTGSEFDDASGGLGGSNVSSSGIEELEVIYFDFNKYDIRDDSKAKLRSNATLINKNKDWGTITIEGYCDERGTEEYNLALGERRANSVKGYLSDLGVASERLATVSFGEAKPRVMGHDESAWRYNRRSEFSAGR